MFALTIDQRGSRTGTDAVPRLLRILAPIETVLSFERTVGDEVQGLLDNPAAVSKALQLVIRDGVWSVGLGIGTASEPLPNSVREASGTALIVAREAVEAAKSANRVRVRVRSTSASERAAEIEALIRLIGTLLIRRTAAQWRVIDAVRSCDTQRAAATALQVSPQAISKALVSSGIDVEDAGYPLLERLLREADKGGAE